VRVVEVLLGVPRSIIVIDVELALLPKRSLVEHLRPEDLGEVVKPSVCAEEEGLPLRRLHDAGEEGILVQNRSVDADLAALPTHRDHRSVDPAGKLPAASGVLDLLVSSISSPTIRPGRLPFHLMPRTRCSTPRARIRNS